MPSMVVLVCECELFLLQEPKTYDCISLVVRARLGADAAPGRSRGQENTTWLNGALRKWLLGLALCKD